MVTKTEYSKIPGVRRKSHQANPSRPAVNETNGTVKAGVCGNTLKTKYEFGLGSSLVEDLNTYKNHVILKHEEEKEHKNKTCYKCHKKGHIAKNCNKYCKTCGKNHNSNECYYRCMYIINQIAMKMKNSYVANTNFLENKLQVLKSNKNRKARQNERQATVIKSLAKERAQQYPTLLKIEHWEYQQKAKINNNRFDIARSNLEKYKVIKKPVVVKEVFTNELHRFESDEYTCEYYLKDMISPRIQEVGRDLAAVLEMPHYTLKMKALKNKNLLAATIEEKTSFFGRNKVQLTLTYEVSYEVKMLPDEQLIKQEMEKMRLKGKVRLHHKIYPLEKSTLPIKSIKQAIEKYQRQHTVMTTLFSLDSLNQQYAKKLEQVNLLDSEIQNKLKKIKKLNERAIDVKKKKRAEMMMQIKLNTKIVKKQAQLEKLLNKINDNKAYLNRIIKRNIKDETAQARTSAVEQLKDLNKQISNKTSRLKSLSDAIKRADSKSTTWQSCKSEEPYTKEDLLSNDHNVRRVAANYLYEGVSGFKEWNPSEGLDMSRMNSSSVRFVDDEDDFMEGDPDFI